MSEVLLVAVSVAAICGYLGLALWWLDRHWSEFEWERAELAHAIDELAIALGEELRSPLERLARVLARLGEKL